MKKSYIKSTKFDNEKPLKNLESVLKLVRKRPGMYLYKPSIYALGSLITGVNIVTLETTQDHCARSLSLQSYIEYKYKICNTGWNWTRILHHIAGTEQKALDLFFVVWEQYLNDKDNFIIEDFKLQYPENSVTNEFWKQTNEFWKHFNSQK